MMEFLSNCDRHFYFFKVKIDKIFFPLFSFSLFCYFVNHCQYSQNFVLISHLISEQSHVKTRKNSFHIFALTSNYININLLDPHNLHFQPVPVSCSLYYIHHNHFNSNPLPSVALKLCIE